jgi:ribonuclease HII
VAGAVHVPPDVFPDASILRDADDSKRVPESRRASLVRELHEVASAAVGWVDAHLVDALGASDATHLAMRAAVLALASRARGGAIEGPGWHARRASGAPVDADILLVDGYPIVDAPAAQVAIVRGDRQCLTIACASLVAKVARDTYMRALAYAYPTYGFERHVGYGTRDHIAAIFRQGLTPLHRRRFQPMRHLERCSRIQKPALPTCLFA